MTAYATVKTAVEAMKRGAFDYITKPLEVDELMLLVDRALDKLGPAAHRFRTQVTDGLANIEQIGDFVALERVARYLGHAVAPSLDRSEIVAAMAEAVPSAPTPPYDLTRASALALHSPTDVLRVCLGHVEPLPAFRAGEVPMLEAVGATSRYHQHPRFFCAARVADADVDDVMPAWRDYLRRYPVVEAMGAWDFPQLLLWGGLIHHGLGDAPAGDVAARVRADIASLERD